jgi:hypothetical protein
MNAAYLLDTNVLSELMRDSPSSVVMAWFAQRPQAAMRKKGTLPFKGTEKRGKVASSLLKQAFLWGGLQPARAD